MRAVIQRVLQAKVDVDERMVGSIAHGALILLGVTHNDTRDDAEWLCGKIARMRIFNDFDGVMNLPLRESGGNALVVSQFTLHASTKKGNRPSYVSAARPELAQPLYEKFKTMMSQQLGKQVESGIFGAIMQVHLVNDGPVTIIIDSKNRD